MCKRTGIVKRAFVRLMSFVLVLSVCLCSKITARAVAMPILPYIPPELVHVIDYIYNSYGVTAPEINEDYERMKAYVKIYARSNNVSEEQAWADLIAAVDQGKTSGYLVINASLNAMINGTLAYSVEHGIQYGESYPASYTAAQWQQRIEEQYGISADISVYNRIYNSRGTEYLSNTESFLLYAIGKKAGSDYPRNIDTITFMTMATGYGTTGKVKLYSNGYYYPFYLDGRLTDNPVSVIFYVYNWDSSNRTVGSYIGSAAGGCAFYSITEQGTTAAYAGSVATVQAQNQQIGQGLVTGAVYAISAFTQLQENGTIDTTLPVVIPMPAVDTVPATTVSDLPVAQGQNGAVPAVAGTDVQSILQALQQAQQAQYGEVSEYSLDLTEYFPFCIPFDIGNLLTMFVAEPQAPRVEFQLPIGYDPEQGILWDDFVFDLSQFDAVAVWVRRGMLLVFIVGLGMVTRQVFTRG